MTDSVADLLAQVRTDPGGLTGEYLAEHIPLLHEVPDLATYPSWFQQVVLVGEFDTELMMDGLLGWYENNTPPLHRATAEALRAVGLPEDADLIDQLPGLLDADQLARDNASLEAGTVSSFVQRHDVPSEVLDRVAALEEQLYYHGSRDLYAALVAFCDRHLRTP